MPWTEKQLKSIRARAHGWKGKGAFKGLSKKKAETMEHEGVRAPVPSAGAQAKALKEKRGK